MYIKHYQNGSRFYQFILWVDLHGTYYIVKNGTKIWFFKIKHIVSYQNDAELDLNNYYKNEDD